MEFLKKHKKILIEILILLAIFFIAATIFGRYSNNSNDDMTADMDVASFPQISFDYVGFTLNSLAGYQHAMNIPDVRDTITPIVNGEVTINIDDFDNQIHALNCRVYSLDGTQVLAEKTVESPKEQEIVSLGDAALVAEEKVLEVSLKTGDEREIYFYTRIAEADDKLSLIHI